MTKLFVWIQRLSLVGIILAIYLLWEQLFHPSIKPCNINSTINCNAIISGAVSKTLGISTPLYGLVGYIVIFISTFFKKKKIILGMSTFGLLFCLRLGIIEIFSLHVICPVCIACQILMIIIFIFSIILVSSGYDSRKQPSHP